MHEHSPATPSADVGAGVSTALNPGCVITEEWAGPAVVIAVAGVLDMLTAPQLEAGIAASRSKNPSAIIVDLTGVDFLASAGMAVLVDACERADAAAVKFRVVADAPSTSRPLKLLGLADMIGLHPTIDQARATLTG